MTEARVLVKMTMYFDRAVDIDVRTRLGRDRECNCSEVDAQVFDVSDVCVRGPIERNRWCKDWPVCRILVRCYCRFPPRIELVLRLLVEDQAENAARKSNWKGLFARLAGSSTQRWLRNVIAQRWLQRMHMHFNDVDPELGRKSQKPVEGRSVVRILQTTHELCFRAIRPQGSGSGEDLSSAAVHRSYDRRPRSQRPTSTRSRSFVLPDLK